MPYDRRDLPPLFTTSRGQRVYAARMQHIRLDMEVLAELCEVLEPAEGMGQRTITATIKGQPPGWQVVVPTGEEDVIFYARRKQKPWLSRFIVGREAQPTDQASAHLDATAPDEWSVRAAFWGDPAPQEPVALDATVAERRYWTTHAFVEAEQHDPATRVEDCPWPLAGGPGPFARNRQELWDGWMREHPRPVIAPPRRRSDRR